MGLVRCADCGTQFSDTVSACIKCGRAVTGPSSVSAATATVPLSTLVAIKCANCAADLRVDPRVIVQKCEYCGGTFHLDTFHPLSIDGPGPVLGRALTSQPLRDEDWIPTTLASGSWVVDLGNRKADVTRIRVAGSPEPAPEKDRGSAAPAALKCIRCKVVSPISACNNCDEVVFHLKNGRVCCGRCERGHYEWTCACGTVHDAAKDVVVSRAFAEEHRGRKNPQSNELGAAFDPTPRDLLRRFVDETGQKGKLAGRGIVEDADAKAARLPEVNLFNVVVRDAVVRRHGKDDYEFSVGLRTDADGLPSDVRNAVRCLEGDLDGLAKFLDAAGVRPPTSRGFSVSTAGGGLVAGLLGLNRRGSRCAERLAAALPRLPIAEPWTITVDSEAASAEITAPPLRLRVSQTETRLRCVVHWELALTVRGDANRIYALLPAIGRAALNLNKSASWGAPSEGAAAAPATSDSRACLIVLIAILIFVMILAKMIAAGPAPWRSFLR